MSDEVIDYLDIDGVQYGMGWSEPTEEDKELIVGFKFQTLEDTEIDDVKTEDLPKTVYLGKYAKQVIGQDHLKVMNQLSLGSCVAFGCCRAIEYSNLVEIGLGDSEEFKYLNRILVYAGSRVQIGGGRLRGDGSNGIWAADFVRKYGILPAEGVIEGFDLSVYSVDLGRQLGRTGVPDKLEPYLKEHPVRETTKVKTVEQCQKALANGYGVSVASTQGFSTSRDSNGICSARGSWAHQMCIAGYTWIKDKLYFLIENSWAEYMGQNNKPPIGNNGSFLASADTVSRMLGQDDSFCFAGVQGFKKKIDQLDWSF